MLSRGMKTREGMYNQKRFLALVVPKYQTNVRPFGTNAASLLTAGSFLIILELFCLGICLGTFC